MHIYVSVCVCGWVFVFVCKSETVNNKNTVYSTYIHCFPKLPI